MSFEVALIYGKHIFVTCKPVLPRSATSFNHSKPKWQLCLLQMRLAAEFLSHHATALRVRLLCERSPALKRLKFWRVKIQDTTALEEHAKLVPISATGEFTLIYTETEFSLSLVYTAATGGDTNKAGRNQSRSGHATQAKPAHSVHMCV